MNISQLEIAVDKSPLELIYWEVGSENCDSNAGVVNVVKLKGLHNKTDWTLLQHK